MTRDEAERLSTAFLQIIGLLNQTAAFVRDKDSIENWHQYRRAVGRSMGSVIELAEPLLARFPELRPEQLGGPYKVDPQIYEQRFYDWDDGDVKSEQKQ